jgi:hypothetical protein
MQTILPLVEAEEGVAILPASPSNLRSNGVQFVRLVPDLYLDRGVATKRDLSRSPHISRLSECQCGCDSLKGRTGSILHRLDQVIAL